MNLPKIFIFLGLFFIFVGIMVWLFGKVGLPFGRLPGDIFLKGEKHSFYFPIITSIVLSIFLTIIINFILWLFRR